VQLKKAYKIRIYPNKKQQGIIDHNINSTRFVYNFFLDFKIKEYQKNKNSYSHFDTCKLLTILKQQEEFYWLKESDSQALIYSLKNLDNAYKKFFNKKLENCFPNFKSRKTCKMSYTTRIRIIIKDNKIRIPMLGFVKFKDKNKFLDIVKIYNCTITKTKTGKYYASVLCDCENQAKQQTGAVIGIDLGIKDLIITSDEVKIKNPKFFKKSKIKLNKLYKSYKNKKYKSKNQERAKIKFFKLCEKIENQKNNYIHNATNKLITENSFIGLETLKINSMTEYPNLFNAIKSASWAEIVRQLEYKALWNNREIVKVSQFFPSSQICSNCGNKSKQTKDLSLRIYDCQVCGFKIDRDYNASINILKEALRISSLNIT